MKGTPITDSYTSTRDAAIKKIKSAAEKHDDELLNEVAEEVDPKKRAERDKNCQVVRMLVDKCLEEYQEGEYSFSRTVDMLCGALNKIK